MKTITKAKRYLVLVLICVLLMGIAISPASADEASTSVSGVVSGAAVELGDFSGQYQTLYYGDAPYAETDNLQLWVDENTAHFKVVNKLNNYSWYSSPQDIKSDNISKTIEKDFAQSVVNITYVNKVDEVSAKVDTYKVLNTNSCLPEDIKVESLPSGKNGFRAVFTFNIDLTAYAGDDESADEDIEENAEIITAKIVVPTEFEINGDKLDAKIDTKNVKCDDRLIITAYELLPYFGAANWNQDGYIFVPDGSGALINFKGHEDSQIKYSEWIYGDDLSLEQDMKTVQKETIRMPIFGMVNKSEIGDNAMFAVITNGSGATQINANPTNLTNGYSSVSATAMVKLTSAMVMFGKSANRQEINRLSKNENSFDSFSIQYSFLAGSDANYVGMANTYRSYLESKGSLTKENSASKPVLNVDLYAAIDVTANFLGFSYKKLESLTTYSQAETIISKLQEKGITDLGVRFRGWGNNGVTNKEILTSAKYVGKLGGEKDFNHMADFFKEKGVSLTLDADLITFTKGRSKVAAKTAFAETYYKYQYMRSVYAYKLKGISQMMLNPKYIGEYSEKYINSFSKDVNCDNISLSSITNAHYSSLRNNNTVYRTEMPGYVNSVLQKAKDAKLNVSGEKANDYNFKYLSKIYHAPLYSSAYAIFDEEIPFYQILLHGRIAMTSDPLVQSVDIQTTFLKSVESGIELLWNGIYEDSAQLSETNYDYLYGSSYNLWIDNAADKYSQYHKLLQKIYNKTIVAHGEATDADGKVINDVSFTQYDNGITVFVNFTASDVVLADGTKVEAKNFAYKEG